ncbi:site-specific integrase [Enterovibrio norvegicus]|uniref:site-specific integrase n=1 Tax=Enterovibrio norvegicus TaxID=188144 RepID=UPI000C830E99|nr:site-specific integrase [Enterovibrio norvegicus]PMN73138.1 integrase [Enterovibrio norvegicus]
MALPTLIEDSQRKWLFKVTAQSKEADLNLCLLGFFLGSGMTTLELCRVQVGDVITKSGELARCFAVRGDVERDFYLSNGDLKALVKRYIEKRKKDGDHPDYFQGHDPSGQFFTRSNGDAFNVKRRTTARGNDSYHCNALNNHIKRLLNDGGIESPSILSGRRTFAVRLKRHGVDVPTIHLMLGNKDLSTTYRLLDSDPVDMGAIAEMAF